MSGLQPNDLPSHADKRAFVREMFDRISPRYDLVNRLITLGLDQRWRRALLDALRVGPGDRVLDLATGTGDLVELAAARGARAFGVDFSAGMLASAGRRDADLDLVQGDAVALPVAARSIDVVTCGFALRNFAELGEVFAECARVLVPGGRLGLLEVDAPESRWLRAGHALHFRHLVPRLGAWLSDREAYRYLPASAAYLPDAAALSRMLERAGFDTVERTRHLAGATQRITARRTP